MVMLVLLYVYTVSTRLDCTLAYQYTRWGWASCRHQITFSCSHWGCTSSPRVDAHNQTSWISPTCGTRMCVPLQEYSL